jgi:hypothetical protein
MTPEQKLEAIRTAVDQVADPKSNSAIGPFVSAYWLKNILDLPTSPFTGQDDPDMERVIKVDMKLHESSCATNQKSITREYKGCDCWLADPPKPEYSSFYVKPKSKATRLNDFPFYTREDAHAWILCNTTYSNDPESLDYWGHDYDIIEKEPITK